MSDTVPAENASAAPESPQDAPNGRPQGDDQGAHRSGGEIPPEGMRAELERARKEAAKFRERAREFADDETYKRAQDAIAALDKVEQEKRSEVDKLSEANAGLTHRATAAEQDLVKLRVALGAGIAAEQVDEFASRLRGDTEDELRADAEHLATLFVSASPRRGDPSQGAGNDDMPGSPQDQLAAFLRNHLSPR